MPGDGLVMVSLRRSITDFIANKFCLALRESQVSGTMLKQSTGIQDTPMRREGTEIRGQRQDAQQGLFSKAARALARSVRDIREHGSGPRTPMAAFFNVLLA